MGLVCLLCGLVGEDDVEGDLIGLVHDGAVAGNHAAGVELLDARDGAQEFFSGSDELRRGLGIGGVEPKDDDVGEHFSKR